MAIKLFGGKLLIGKQLNQYVGQADNYFGLMQQKYGTDYRVRNRLNAYRGVVYGCVSLIGDALGEYTPYVEEKRGKTWERVDHEFISLLKQPGGYNVEGEASTLSGFGLWEETGIFQLLQGDAFWYLAKGKTTGKPREIIVLRADKVGTDVDPKTGKVTGYFIRRSDGDPIPLEIDEVLRFPQFNPKDPYKGLSTVEAGSDYIQTDEYTSEYTKNFFLNNAGLSGVLSIKGEVTKGAFKKFVRQWRDKYEGVTNAGKMAIIRDSDATFEKVGLGLDELDMATLRKMSMEDVAMMFRVPLPLLGKISEGSSFGRGNIETLEYIFAKWNIDKKMLRFDAVIAFALQRYYGLDPDTFRVRHENIIPIDKEFELEERTAAVDKWLTRNEIRAEEEVGEAPGGDKLYVGAMEIPIDEATEPAATSTSASLKDVPITVKITRRKLTAKKKRSNGA